jgi:tight adherence protein C
VAVTYLVKGTMGARSHADERVRTIDLYGYGAVAPAAATPANTKSGALAFAQRVGDVIGNRFGTDSDSKIRKEILAAGLYTLTPRALVGYQVVAAAIGAMFGLATDGIPNLEGPIIDTVLFAGFFWLLPITYVRRTGRLRTDLIERGVPEVVDLVVVSVEAGQGFAQALQTAADRTDGPLGDELKLTLQEQRFGLSMDRALENLNMRADTPNMRTFVRGVVQGERLGVSIGQIMRNIAVDMRMRRRQAAEERAQKTTVKILIPVVFFILPPFILILMAPAIMSLGDAF